ncbi:M-phase inducer phosphatase 1-B-like isoform X2 [Narcine bancroftii]|uniref:M-phase inducer phosphatase 1-B-like isoform X2 n=1 Tax=Narcine bancroftii TaxID=1343680 RepID=UPI003831A202
MASDVPEMFANCPAAMDESEAVPMALSPDFCPSYRLNSRKLLSVIQDSNSSMSFSPEPLQNHSLNVSNLSFCDGETPKRCLDLSNLSNGGEASTSPENVCRGLCLDSPDLPEAQRGGSTCFVGRPRPLLGNDFMYTEKESFRPEILCSSPMLVMSDPQNLVKHHMDLRSLDHNKENVGFEADGVGNVTSVDSLCLDYPMAEDSTCDGFLELNPCDPEGDSNMNVAVSSSMAALFSSDIMNQGMDTSLVSVCRSRPGLFRSPSMPERLHKSFLKRSERSQEMDTPVKTKRQKSFDCSSEHQDLKRQESQFMRPVVAGCKVNVTSALDDERDPMELIGNFSKVYALPTVTGKHEDLKYITPETMAKVLHGEYDHLLGGIYIVDCRYPYEFEGGHIKGALNLHTADDAVEYFLKEPIISQSKDKRLIIIFHCEFSSERGPKMCRSVREEDRSMNDYPNLYYPELYILKGGYKAFFPMFTNYCDPPKYCPMDHVDFQEEMLKLRKKSKSWAGERRRRDLISRLWKM